ncbi:DUF4404 family protein [Rugamonas sp. FT82W]|uniref:DUF4404 family protein n=1 Tax=Duganella vulcania TaxID=2692166 RepID=A0A845FXP1_9BURK|nr:DUF4404 family protein [Duganella vulcania]MYM86002.1 DUF4404 family protein [Duganella vulcania]
MDSNLKASLSTLRNHLASAGPIDDELQELLTQLDGDIKQLLERRAAEAEPGESTTYGLAERTQEISAKFAVRHPQLEPALRELGNILSSMGI